MSSIVVKCEQANLEEGVQEARAGRRGAAARGAAARGTLARACAAEAAGTALLVLLLCLQSTCAAAARAAGGGAAVSLLVHSLGHVSGAQLNPALTLAAALLRRQTPARAALEMCSQLAGAALGGAGLLLLAPATLPLCCTAPAPHVTHYRALCIEAVCAGCLVLANLATWDARRSRQQDSWPLRLGAAVAALSLAAGELTGASMNPARSFGPALLAGDFTAHWVYWAGPLLGSAAATLMYQLLWAVPAAPAAHRAAPAAAACRCSEARPLQD